MKVSPEICIIKSEKGHVQVMISLCENGPLNMHHQKREKTTDNGVVLWPVCHHKTITGNSAVSVVEGERQL